MLGFVRKLARIDPLGEFGRTLIAALVAWLVVYLLLPSNAEYEVSSPAYWDAWALVYLGLTWFMIIRSSPERTRLWALNQRDTGSSCLLRLLLVVLFIGRTGSLLFVILVSLVGMFLAFSLLPPVRDLETLPGVLVIVLNGFGVIAAWAVLHTAYSLYYARLYYRSEESFGGLEFPGDKEPDLLDFAYFSFSITANLGLSDVTVTEPTIRRVVLGHMILSFAYNTAILAMVVNLVVY
jgi:uncharacterized membrane protein